MHSSITNIYSEFTAIGRVSECNYRIGSFRIELLTGDSLLMYVSRTTWYEVLKNITGQVEDDVPDPTVALVDAEIGPAGEDPLYASKVQMLKYLLPGRLVYAIGVYSREGGVEAAGGKEHLGARRVVLMHTESHRCGWETSHWWLRQVNVLFEQWLDTLFDSKRELTENDFAQFYRTSLDLLGSPTDDVIQECATLSRFLYGLASSYLLTGNLRSLSASKSCAKYLMNAYREMSHDERRLLWKYGRRRVGRSTKEIHASENPEDLGTYACYEQIYVLSGLAQYYRITLDPEVLDHIVRTIDSFNTWFHDEMGKGYYSHLNPITQEPDGPQLAQRDNVRKKNWNSIGDHIPAYLVNVLLAIDPLPVSRHHEKWKELRDKCREMLEECVTLILDKFPPVDSSAYVFERFFEDYTPQLDHGWQQNRAIVGHNLKISWNLTRCGHYYRTLAAECERDTVKASHYRELARRCFTLAVWLGRSMARVGVDRVRGGIFDAVERHPGNGMSMEFAWSTTKDFWQQEQAILAYYIMHGIEDDDVFGGRQAADATRAEFLALARSCAAFWSMFFVDYDYRKIYFRTAENGAPVISGQYGVQAGHAIAGYHAFELSFLAHIYIRTYAAKALDREHGAAAIDARKTPDSRNFLLHFCPLQASSVTTLNVLPDFMSPGSVKIVRVRVNGLVVPPPPEGSYQVDISSLPPNTIVAVEMEPKGEELMWVAAKMPVQPKLQFLPHFGDDAELTSDRFE